MPFVCCFFSSKRFVWSNAWGEDFPVREFQSVHGRIDALCIVSVFFRWQVLLLFFKWMHFDFETVGKVIDAVLRGRF